jgi:hypothetical protein
MTCKKRKVKKFNVLNWMLDVLFGGPEASSVTWKFFMDS